MITDEMVYLLNHKYKFLRIHYYIANFVKFKILTDYIE